MIVLHQISHTLGARLLIGASRAVLLLVLARVLMPEEFAAYSLITSGVALAISITGLNLSAYLYRSIPGALLTEARRMFSTVVTIELSLTAAVVAVALATDAVGALARALGAGSFSAAFRFGSILLIAEVLCQDLLNFLLGRQAIQKANLLDIIKQAVWILPVVAIWLSFGRLDVTQVLVLNIAGVGTAAAYGLLRVGWRDLPRPDLSLLRPALSFAVPLILPILSFNLLKVADRYFLAAFRELEEVAVYAFAVSLTNLLYMFSSLVIASTLTPYAIRAHNEGDPQRRDRLLFQTLKYGVWSFVVGAIGLMLAGPSIIALVRPQYALAMTVLPWTMLGYFMVIVATPANNRLYAESRALTILRIDVTGAVVALLLDLMLIPAWGFYGAAAATGTGFALIAVWKYAASGIWRALPWSELASADRELQMVRERARGWMR